MKEGGGRRKHGGGSMEEDPKTRVPMVFRFPATP